MAAAGMAAAATVSGRRVAATAVVTVAVMAAAMAAVMAAAMAAAMAGGGGRSAAVRGRVDSFAGLCLLCGPLPAWLGRLVISLRLVTLPWWLEVVSAAAVPVGLGLFALL